MTKRRHRADYHLIKDLTTVKGPEFAREYQQMPLVVIDIDTLKAMEDISKALEEDEGEKIYNEILNAIARWTTQYKNTLVLYPDSDAAVAFEMTEVIKMKTGAREFELRWDYFRKIQPEDTDPTVTDSKKKKWMNEKARWMYTCSSMAYQDDGKKDLFDRYEGDLLTNMGCPRKVIDVLGEDLRKFSFIFMVMLRWVEVEGRLPVEERCTDYKPKSIHQKRPYLKDDNCTIRFLNSLPKRSQSDSKPHLGGSHRSPVFHYRKPHKRTLRSEKYQKHPLFGIEGGIDVPGTWVGDQSIVLENEKLELRVRLPKGTKIEKEKAS